MKKRLLFLALPLCILIAFAGIFMPVAAKVQAAPEKGALNRALMARFTNMLNRNYSYNADFESADKLADNSLLALLKERDSQNPDYISDTIVKGFINDMYGLEIVEIKDDDNMHKDGFVYIAPRGYTAYSHEVTNISTNEDGSFTVKSKVKVTPHDDEPFVTSAETLFVPNTNSAFGYNIIYSNLSGIESGI